MRTRCWAGPGLRSLSCLLAGVKGRDYGAQAFNRHFSEPGARTLLTGDIPGVASIFEGQVLPKADAYAPCADGVIAREAPDFAGFGAADDIVIAGMHLTTLYTRTRTFPAGHYLTSGPVAGIDADAVAPKTTTAALGQWLDARYNGQPFIWVHARCDPITEAQLTMLLCPADGPCNCTPDGQRGGLNADLCQFTQLAAAPADTLVRVGDTLDLVAAAWSPVITAPATLDVYLRWTVLSPYENLTAYLALKDASGLIWAEGSAPLASRDDWLKSARSPGNQLDGQVAIPLLASLPPGTYSLALSFSDEANRGMGLTNPDGTFGGIRKDMGTVAVASNAGYRPEVTLPERLNIALPGYHVRAALAPPAELFAGDPLPFRLEMARTASAASASASDTTEAISWIVVCAGDVRARGDVLDLPGNPEAWASGHYYELRYAPRTDPTSPDADCTLILQSGDSTAGASWRISYPRTGIASSAYPKCRR